MEHIPSLTNAQLIDMITTWSGRVAAGEARLLALIAESDEREAWGGPGMLSCAHWLTWRTGPSPGAAREKVRVARGAGHISFSQARAVTRPPPTRKGRLEDAGEQLLHAAGNRRIVVLVPAHNAAL